jgi:hypothetical protein
VEQHGAADCSIRSVSSGGGRPCVGRSSRSAVTIAASAQKSFSLTTRHARLTDRPARRRPGRRGQPRRGRATPVRRLVPAKELRHAPIHGLPPDLKLPAEAIDQIADDTRDKRATSSASASSSSSTTPEARSTCLLEGPAEGAIRRHCAALGVPCGDVHPVGTLI